MKEYLSRLPRSLPPDRALVHDHHMKLVAATARWPPWHPAFVAASGTLVRTSAQSAGRRAGMAAAPERCRSCRRYLVNRRQAGLPADDAVDRDLAGR
jgi:hypothetical protein